MTHGRPVAMCTWCTRFDWERYEQTGRRRCPAFPNGIPKEIDLGFNPHTEPYPGDHGLLYDEVPEMREDDEALSTSGRPAG